MCSIIIRQMIAAIELNQIFSTRQFLSYGKRAAVDQVFYRLVKSKQIKRVARGLFIKKGSTWPTLEEIAIAKAKAFGRLLVEHSGKIASQLKLCEAPTKNFFDISGRSSKFNSHGSRIHYQGIANRKMLLDGTELGRSVRAIWKQKRENFDSKCVAALRQALCSFDSSMLPRLSLLMPAWINDQIVPNYEDSF